jgi:hypothetical protein
MGSEPGYQGGWDAERREVASAARGPRRRRCPPVPGLPADITDFSLAEQSGDRLHAGREDTSQFASRHASA